LFPLPSEADLDSAAEFGACQGGDASLRAAPHHPRVAFNVYTGPKCLICVQTVLYSGPDCLIHAKYSGPDCLICAYILVLTVLYVPACLICGYLDAAEELGARQGGDASLQAAPHHQRVAFNVCTGPGCPIFALTVLYSGPDCLICVLTVLYFGPDCLICAKFGADLDAAEDLGACQGSDASLQAAPHHQTVAFNVCTGPDCLMCVQTVLYSGPDCLIFRSRLSYINSECLIFRS